MRKLNSTSRYLVAVSGGPDSMALLDMCVKQDLYLEVAHMNYHHRQSADRDEKIVKNYCRKHHISFHRTDFNETDLKGNFQDNARKQRYAFFEKICAKKKLDLVLIAHNLDDFIETYLMQKQKNIGVAYYGIKRRNVINGIKIYRPLLDTEKKKLEQYCINNNIVYGIDETNLSDMYTRNRIRHEKVEKMTSKQKKELYRDVIALNKDLERRLRITDEYLKGNSFSVDYFLDAPDLELYMHRHFPDKSQKSISEILRQLKEAKHGVFKGKDILLVKEYGQISKSEPVKDYEFIFNDLRDIEYRRYDIFRLSEKGNSFEGVTIDHDDFPLTIRNYKPHDEIQMNYGSKGINRFFIDKKITYYDRHMWPVVVNKDRKIILVPGLGCDQKHYSKKHNFFVIKYERYGRTL